MFFKSKDVSEPSIVMFPECVRAREREAACRQCVGCLLTQQFRFLSSNPTLVDILWMARVQTNASTAHRKICDREGHLEQDLVLWHKAQTLRHWRTTTFKILSLLFFDQSSPHNEITKFVTRYFYAGNSCMNADIKCVTKPFHQWYSSSQRKY